MTRIGYLSPEGEFYECEPWEHLDKATEIAESLTHRTPLTRLDYIYRDRKDAEKLLRRLAERDRKAVEEYNRKYGTDYSYPW